MGHDEQYEHDITEAGRRAQRMRRGGDLARVLWLLNEKASWQLEVQERVLASITSGGGVIDHLVAIKQKIDEGVAVDLGPTNALLAQILALLSPGAEPGNAASLNLTMGPPQPNA